MSTELPNIKLKDVVDKPTYFAGGHRLCAGCAAGSMARQVTMAFNKPTMIFNATGCLEVASTIYPFSAWKVPWLHVAFENASAVASGVEGAIKAMTRKGIYKDGKTDIVVFGGDGGTYDIGIQALSGALERGHDLLYILYDNGAYMNTGIQRSGGTPYGASTTTSPAGSVIPGKTQFRKPITEIIIAHRIKFVATASPAYPEDLIAKVRAGLDVDGPAFLHVESSCNRGQRFDPAKSIEYVRLATETCLHPLYSVIEGEYKLSRPSERIAKDPSKKLPLEEYLKLEGRWRHFFKPTRRDDLINIFQTEVDKRWEELLEKTGY
ncbi:MAG: pyruvate ferredoxin oxidoreductase [Candidatus Heimdallarchaeota archaeon]|nr:pyruvate ferredoxin oxidoreductase [Candidatus Heimdallarchaeota archaeon]